MRRVETKGEDMAEYLTTDGVAELTGRTRRAIEKMVERRQIPFRKHGKRVIFKRSEIERFLDSLPGLTLEDIQTRERVGV
jgi:excisionase family DNA binding protein